MARVAEDGAGAETLVELFEAIPRRERLEVARAVFARLPPEQQWVVVERTFGDEEIRTAIEAERQHRLAEERRSGARRELVRAARTANRLDTRHIPPDERLTLGLFREPDVRAALPRGHRSTACARRLVLAAHGQPGTFRVIEDVFNPDGGYFVTRDYDEETWRAGERLAGHTIVRVGSLAGEGGGATFEPVLYAGGRTDFEIDGERRTGRLHLGYAMVGDDDVFAERGADS